MFIRCRKYPDGSTIVVNFNDVSSFYKGVGCVVLVMRNGKIDYVSDTMEDLLDKLGLRI